MYIQDMLEAMERRQSVSQGLLTLCHIKFCLLYYQGLLL
jgi:hypothetical protein